MSSGPSRVAGFSRVRSGGHRVYPGTQGSLRCTLGVVRFIQALLFIGIRPGGSRVYPRSLVSLGCARGVVGFIKGRWIHWCAPWESSGSSGVAGFIGVRPLLSSGSSGVTGFIVVCPGGRRVHPGSLGSFGCTLEDVWFIRGRCIHPEARRRSSGSSRFAGFIEVRSGGRGDAPGSLRSSGCAVGVVGFMRGRWVHLGTPWG